MRQEIGEALSALADGEASELDLRRVLRSVDDPEVLESWARWHRHADALQGRYASHVGDTPAFLQRVRAGIADVQEQANTASSEVPSRRASGAKIGSVPQQRWWSRPFGGLAVAASVAAVAVLVGQNLPLEAPPVPASGTQTVEVSGFALPAFPVSGGNMVPVGSNLSGGSVPPAHVYQELARERLNLYRSLHAEQAAMSGREGLVPYVRAGALPLASDPAGLAGDKPAPVSSRPTR